ncbi:vascular cell adhesion protein 1b [Engraulis encrasicolus]|uniref:vascular cell adhesion protein 1b n=1 Tax=Engraulis encrasicolus TaxID=184585 RepID=UPI002FD3A487
MKREDTEDNHMKLIMSLSLLWMLLFPPAVLSFSVEVSPKKAVFRIGDRETVVCRVKGCDGPATFMWEGKEDRPLFVDKSETSEEAQLAYSSVQKHHENQLVCRAKCGEQVKQRQVTVKVFSFPSAPLLSGLERVVLGERVCVQCEARGVYPPTDTHMELEMDGALVAETETDTETLRTQHCFTATNTHHGRNVTCQATHTMTDTTIQDTTPIAVLYPPSEVKVAVKGANQEQALIEVTNTEQALEEVTHRVAVGSSITLTCSAQAMPRPQLQWRFRGSHDQWEELGGAELRLVNVRYANAGRYECQATNKLGNSSKRLELTVTGPPRNTSLVLSPSQPIREGESVIFSCRSSSQPMAELRLLRGEEPLAEGRGQLDFTLTDAQLNQSGRYTCHAHNLYGNQSNSTNLTVTVFPLQVSMLARGNGLGTNGEVQAEIGSTLSLSCSAIACPHAQISWEVPPLTQLTQSLSMADLIRPVSNQSLRVDSPSQEGVYACHAHCGSAHASQIMQLRPYSFPSAPVIEHSGSSVEGGVSVFACVVRDVYPPSSFRLRWLSDGEELPPLSPSPPPPTLHPPSTTTTTTLTSLVSMVMEPSLQGRTLSCQVELLMGDVFRERNATTTIHVHRPPRNTSLVLSPSQPIREGESVVFSCRSSSQPMAELRLLRGEELLAEGRGQLDFTLTDAQLNQSGQYTCHAHNLYGNQSSSTNLTVTAPPRDTVVEVLPSPRVTEGSNVTICCRSVSYPPPLVTLRKLPNHTYPDTHSHTHPHNLTHNHTLLTSPNGTFHLSHLTPEDAGQYLVNVSNQLGHHTHVFTIIVTERSRSPPTVGMEVVAVGVVMVASLAGAALLINHIMRARKQGSYTLTKA